MKIFDIETQPLPLEQLKKTMPTFEAPSNWKDPEKIAAKIAEQQKAYVDKAALSPTTGSVQAYGVWDTKREEYVFMDVYDNSESDLLEFLWDELTDNGAFTTPVVGWNSNGFDVPFLIKRSWANRVKIPSSLIQSYRGRSYLNEQFKDLMDHFCVGTRDRMKLNDALLMCGLDPKVNLDGKLPYEIFDEDLDLFHKYLHADVLGTAALAEISGI